jgi:uncharacterized protein
LSSARRRRPRIETPKRNPVVGRLRSYGLPPRILGVDLARGLAVLGMYGAHVGLTEPFDWGRPGTWLDLVNGRSSILFALLAGVSIAIISGGTRSLDRDELRRARIRITVRAALIFVLGAWLVWLDSGIAVILPVYAVLFLLALPVLRLRAGWLFLLAAVTALVSPFVSVVVLGLTRGEGTVIDLLFTGNYPAVIWITFVLVGVGVGRLDLRATEVKAALIGVGVVLAAVAYGNGYILSGLVETGPVRQFDFAQLATIEPHSGSQFEVVGSTGFALAVLGLCLLVPSVLRWILYPLAAVGSMALTAYTVHVVIVAQLDRSVFTPSDNGLYLAFIVGALVACSIWTLLLGRGPLERVLTSASRIAARERRVTPAPPARR